MELQEFYDLQLKYFGKNTFMLGFLTHSLYSPEICQYLFTFEFWLRNGEKDKKLINLVNL